MAHIRVQPDDVPPEVWIAAVRLHQTLRDWPDVLHAQITFDHMHGEKPPIFDVITKEPVDV